MQMEPQKSINMLEMVRDTKEEQPLEMEQREGKGKSAGLMEAGFLLPAALGDSLQT